MPKHVQLFLIGLFSFPVFVGAQTPKGSTSQSINSIPSQMRMDTCLGKRFSVVVYLIEDSLGSLTSTNTAISSASLATYSLTQCFNKLNQTFLNWCIGFDHCKTVIIPNYTYNKWNCKTNGVNAIMEQNTPNTICLYLPEEILTTNMYDPPLQCYSFDADTIAPFKNTIVCSKGGVLGTPLYHALGLFFDLPHTYFEMAPTLPTTPPAPLGINSKEFVDKTNSLTHGDGFSDTDADPFPAQYGPNLPPSSGGNCVPISIKDGKGIFYTPPFENYMSHYVDCACKYSRQQYWSMVHYIMRKRLYLH